jgi:serine protease
MKIPLGNVNAALLQANVGFVFGAHSERVMKRKWIYGGLALLCAATMAACSPMGPTPGVSQVKVQNTVAGFQVAINTKATFYATITDSADQRVTWSIEGAAADKGSIDANTGEYTAPTKVPSPDKVIIRATSVANPSLSGTLEITIVIQGGIAGTINIPAGLLNAPSSNPVAQSTSSTQAQPFTPDWSAPRARGQFLIVGQQASNVARVQSASPALARAQVQSVGNDLIRVFVPQGSDDEAFAAKVASEAGVVVQPNYLYKAMALPNDPDFGKQTYLTQIDVQGAWSVQTGLASDNLIAVLDTGANFSHPDLAGRLNNGRDFCVKLNSTTNACEGQDNDSTDIPTDKESGGHGTHAAGIIAANTNNGTGIAGITQGGKILVVKVFGNDGGAGAGVTSADSIALSNGITYATDMGAKVISMSLGIPFVNKGAGNFDQVVEKQLAYAASKGVTMIAAAGNVNTSVQAPDFRVFFPASDDRVLAVGAVDNNNARTFYSAYQGKANLIFAPGGLPGNDQSGNPQGIYSTYGNGYGYLAGTSFAAPQVSAVAGLMISQRPSLTRDQVVQYLIETAKPLGSGLGVGLLQAGAALRKAQNPATQAVSTTIYVYADPLKAGCAPNTAPTNNACFDGNSPQAGRSVVTFTSKSGAVNYSVTINRSGQPLTNGTYRIVACVNKNSNAQACDPGDLAGISSTTIQYSGTTKPGNDITLGQL